MGVQGTDTDTGGCTLVTFLSDVVFGVGTNEARVRSSSGGRSHTAGVASLCGAGAALLASENAVKEWSSVFLARAGCICILHGHGVVGEGVLVVVIVETV